MKKLLAFIMAAVMLLALTACGKKNGGNDENPTERASPAMSPLW